jgi:asparagine synthase (glutamine-hydrolysing)
MNALLEHRGPDDAGVYVNPPTAISLGATRLSIIDLEGGHQPLANEDGTVVAVLNGEVYNHVALREALREAGHQFRTSCDTEVLVHAYEEFGAGLVHALEGMYALAIWDARERRLLLARDRFGEKPLFYRHTAACLHFASELTALVASGCAPRDVEPAALDAYFVLGYVPGTTTVVPGVEQLPPGHVLEWSVANSHPRVRPYWAPCAAEAEGGHEDLVAETERLLERAVQSRLIADVPVGVFLSGGLDSTLVAALAARATRVPVKTFTVGYDVGDVNETDPARAAARAIGAEHHELLLREEELPELARTVFSRLDQPLADQALLASHAVARFAREHVKVVVGGEGADELFGGYPRYRWLSRAARLSGALPQTIATGLADRLGRLPLAGRGRHLAHIVDSVSLLERQLAWVTDGRSEVRGSLYGPLLTPRFEAESMRALATDGAVSLGAARSLMTLDQRLWLPDDVLVKADRASMLASLEVRTPFLERTLAELASSVPAGRHLRRGGKSLLREVLERVIGEDALRRPKTAFRVPAGDWLRGALAPLLREQVEDGTLYSAGFVRREAASRLVDAHLSGRQDHAQVLWPLFVLGVWMDRFLGQ